MAQAYLGSTELNKLYLGTTQINLTENNNAPFINSMVYWFRDGFNNITGSNWTNSITNNITGSLLGGATKSGSIALLNNSSNNLGDRDQSFNIKTSAGTVTVRSMLIMFNQPVSTGVGGVVTVWFCGDGFGTTNFNQYFSVSTDPTSSSYGNNATFFGYVDSQTPVNKGIITQELLTNGTTNGNGGPGELQFMGPTGHDVNTTKRIFFFNYNADVPLVINNIPGFVMGAESNSTTAGSFGLFEMIGYDRSLSFVEFEDLVKYLKSTNVIS